MTSAGGFLAHAVGHEAAGATPRFDPARVLWAVVCLLMGLDVVTTWVGLQVGLQEGNAVVVAAMDVGGFSGFVLLKLAVVGFAALLSSRTPQPIALVIPLGLAIPTLLAVSSNLLLLLAAR